MPAIMTVPPSPPLAIDLRPALAARLELHAGVLRRLAVELGRVYPNIRKELQIAADDAASASMELLAYAQTLPRVDREQ